MIPRLRWALVKTSLLTAAIAWAMVWYDAHAVLVYGGAR